MGECPHGSWEALAVEVFGGWATFFKCKNCRGFDEDRFILAQSPIPQDARVVGTEEIPPELLREAEKWVARFQGSDLGDW